MHELTQLVFVWETKFSWGTLVSKGFYLGSLRRRWTIFMLNAVAITAFSLTLAVISLIIFCFEWTRIQYETSSNVFMFLGWPFYWRSTLLALLHSLILFDCCGQVACTSAKNMTDCVDLFRKNLFLSLQWCSTYWSSGLTFFKCPSCFSSRTFLSYCLRHCCIADNYKTCLLSWRLLSGRRHNRCGRTKHSLGRRKRAMKFLKWITTWSMGMCS